MNIKQKTLVGTLAASAIGAAAVLSGVTSAAFQDIEKHAANSITAGTLDLEYAVTDANGDPVNGPITVSNWKPGDEPTYTVTLRNVGSVDGTALLDVVEKSDAENSLVEPEVAAGDDASWGELGDGLLFFIDGGMTGTLRNTADYPSNWSLGSIPAGGSKTVVLKLTQKGMDQAGVNKLMSDSYTFDLDFILNQS